MVAITLMPTGTPSFRKCGSASAMPAAASRTADRGIAGCVAWVKSATSPIVPPSPRRIATVSASRSGFFHW